MNVALVNLSSRVQTWLVATDFLAVCVQCTCTQITTFSWHPASCYVGKGPSSSLPQTFSGMGGKWILEKPEYYFCQYCEWISSSPDLQAQCPEKHQDQCSGVRLCFPDEVPCMWMPGLLHELFNPKSHVTPLLRCVDSC